MMVSCLCPTYGRCPDFQHLLEEAIESFWRQRLPIDLEAAELVILNDCPQQMLNVEFAATPLRQIRVFDTSWRFRSLGEKFNFLVEQARGDILLPWEDDDTSLPGRIEQAVEKLKGGAGYFNPGSHWLLAEKPAGPEGVGLFAQGGRGVNHNASAFTRKAFETAGGYPPTSGNQDMIFDARLKEVTIVAEPLDPRRPEAFQYVYRWLAGVEHLSQHRGPNLAYALEAQKPHAAGTFTLRPHWRQDYEALCRSAISRSALA